MPVLAFLSYQTKDRHVAAEIRAFFETIGVESFMAHEDIEVSREWQRTILEKLAAANIFVAVLSADYHNSAYCLQESGIAISRGDEITIVPLSIDGAIPPGFMTHIQAKRYEPGNNNDAVIFAGLANHDPTFAIGLMIDRLSLARSFATAEYWFGLLRPHFARASEQQLVDILKAAASNNQISGAWACRDGLRQLFERFGNRLSEGDQNYLDQKLN